MIEGIIIFFAPFTFNRFVIKQQAFLVIYLISLIADLLSGISIGLTGIYIIVELGILNLFSSRFEIGTKEKILAGVLSSLIYLYVARRFFW